MTVTPNAVPPEAVLGARTIGEMPFEGGDVTRALLQRCGVKLARDIELLGCTGAAAAGLSIEEISELRIGLAGGGTGLPCFVDINRFCLAHNTIGGLQDGQEQRHRDHVEAVSRALTREERGRVELIEAARRKQGKTLDERLVATGDILAGRELPDGFEAEGKRDPLAAAAQAARTMAPVPLAEAAWVCPEHKKTDWACRYCVAQAVVQGPLVPTYALHADDDGAESAPDRVGLTPEEMRTAMKDADAKKLEYMGVYVLAATFERRLARVEE